MPKRKHRPGKYGTPEYAADVALLDTITPEERLLLAIFGLQPGETVAQALLSLRADALQSLREEGVS